MLTSNNQYLRPEYLTPLPTTLDAKKSPLALLAQTCSQIGADAPNSKLLQSSEKANKLSKSDSQKDKLDNPSKNVYKPEIPSPREKSMTPEERSNSASNGNRVRTPVNSKPSSTSRCSSNMSSSSPRTSPGGGGGSERKTPLPDVNGERTSTPERSNSDRHTPQAKTAFTPNILTSSSDPAFKDLPLGTFKPGVPPTTSSYLGYPGYPLPMDLMATTLMGQHHAALKSGLSPYYGYGRIKTPETMSSVCRDPYCTGCSVNSHLLGASSAPKVACPAGCAQCDHAKTPTSYAAAYAHAQLAALAAASHLPYVCNWISGDASYCGKRFSNSEELLSHLRTHTSGSLSDGSALAMHPLLHRTYPTPPLSPRYHPYGKASLLPPTLGSSSLGGFPLGHPGLSAYLSPYSLYGPRMGAAPGMHP